MDAVITIPLTVHHVARYLLARQDPASEPISNLKLQKLLYFAEGLSLAGYDRRLWTADRIKAWRDGPVVPDVWHAYKQYGYRPIPVVLNLDMAVYPDWSKDVLDRTLARYGRLDARRLRDLTHGEPPWITAWDRKSTGGSDHISESAMRDRFVASLAQQGDLSALSPKAVWGIMRSVPGWEDEAKTAHEEIAEGRGLSLEELRRLRGL